MWNKREINVFKTRNDPPSETNGTSLYVGDLSLTVCKSELYKVFNKIGEVSSVHIQVDINKKPLGYAFVNFYDKRDAQAALETLNYTKIKGKHCRISWCKPNEARKKGEGNLFIKNLNESIDEKILQDIFKKFGEITSIKIARNRKTNQSNGFGYISFKDAYSAQEAIKQTDSTLLFGKVITVEIFKPKEERIEDKPFTNVYVKFIPTHWTQYKLISIFEEATKGSITHHTFKAASFGTWACLNFATFKQAKTAIKLFNGKKYGDTRLYVARAQKRNERDHLLKNNKPDWSTNAYGTNLCVKNLPLSIDDGYLFQLFAGYGAITSAKIMKYSNGMSKGIGFVAFKRKQSASRAMRELTRTLIYGKQINVVIAKPNKLSISSSRNQRPLSSYSPYPSHMMLDHEQLEKSWRLKQNQPIKNEYNYSDSDDDDDDKGYDDEDYEDYEDDDDEDGEDELKLNDDDHKDDHKDNQRNEFSALKYLNVTAKKRYLTKLFFKKIEPYYPNLAREITEILLKLNEDELMILMSDENRLLNKVCDIAMQLNQEKDDMKNDNMYGDLVRTWLTYQVELKQYIDTFIENGYDDLGMISFMAEQDLKDIGINKIGHRKKLIIFIKQLNDQKSTASNQKEGTIN